MSDGNDTVDNLHLPRNVMVCAERMRVTDPHLADEFLGMMMEAVGLNRRAAAVRAQAWDMYRDVMKDA